MMKDDAILRVELSDGRHFEAPLGWLRAQLERQGLHVITAHAADVLTALDGAPKNTLIDEQRRGGWRGAVAAAELTRRKEVEAQAFYDECDARRAASHTPDTCESGPKPTRLKPR